MRLFVSYARVDQRFCTQVIETLDAHEVWYDQRLYAGQKWWDEIVRQLHICEGMVFLVSSDSLVSKYCQLELQIAIDCGKHIFPVVIENQLRLPDDLVRRNVVDISAGLKPPVVAKLINTIVSAQFSEQGGGSLPPFAPPDYTSVSPLTTVIEDVNDQSDSKDPSLINPDTVMGEISCAMDNDEYDHAVYLIRNAISEGIEPRFVNLQDMLARAEKALDEQAYLRDAAREYSYILPLVRNGRMRAEGCRAFRSFRQAFKDYDPEGIAELCSFSRFPDLTWRPIPEGEVMMHYLMTNDDGREVARRVMYFVPAFEMSKFPITNAQYQMFVDAPDGYSDLCWWEFSSEALAWRKHNPQPLTARSEYGDHPRVRVSWYEAQAFCRWLSHHTGRDIRLPTEEQWQRAAQGDDGRNYPWGNRFDKNLCNTREAGIRRTTRVTRFVSGASPYGVLDMMGNVWEWCENVPYQDRSKKQKEPKRVVRGGSYSTLFRQVRTIHGQSLKPHSQYSTHGFRVIAMLTPSTRRI